MSALGLERSNVADRHALIVTAAALSVAIEALELHVPSHEELPWLRQKLQRADEQLQEKENMNSTERRLHRFEVLTTSFGIAAGVKIDGEPVRGPTRVTVHTNQNDFVNVELEVEAGNFECAAADITAQVVAHTKLHQLSPDLLQLVRDIVRFVPAVVPELKRAPSLSRELVSLLARGQDLVAMVDSARNT